MAAWALSSSASGSIWGFDSIEHLQDEFVACDWLTGFLSSQECVPNQLYALLHRESRDIPRSPVAGSELVIPRVWWQPGAPEVSVAQFMSHHSPGAHDGTR